MLTSVYVQECQQQVVITNDSDLAEPIRVVRQELRMPVGLVNPHPTHRRARHLDADFFRQIRPQALAACQLPTTLKDAQGTFTRPPSW